MTSVYKVEYEAAEVLMRAFPLLLLLAACKDDTPTPEKGLGPGGTLTLESPAPGAWMATGETEATGHARQVDTVTVDGADATLDAGAFSAPLTLVRGINVIEADATDTHGDTLFARHGVLAGTFGSPNGDVTSAIDLRVNQGALDAAGELAAGMVDAETLNASLSAVNPVYTDTYIWDTVTVNADVTNVAFGTPTITITPSSGTLTLTAVLPDLAVDVNAYADAFGYDFDTNVGITASEAVVTGTLRVSASNGRIAVTLEDATVELMDFAYSADLLPSWVSDYLLVETIRDTLEEKIVEQIETMVPPLLEETLGGLDPSLSTELMGLTVDLAFSFADVDVDNDGLAIALDLDVAIPDAGSHEYEGYLLAGHGTPTLNTSADLSAAVSDDLLNRVLFEAWRGGLLDMSLSTEDGSLEPAMLALLQAEEGSITVTATLPPVVVEENGELHAQVGELMVQVNTPGGGLGESLTLSLNADVPLQLQIVDGELKLEMGDPDIVFEVRDSDWGAENETVTRLIEDMLPLDTLLSLLGDIAVPLPSLYGLAVDSGTAARDDDGVHTGVQLYLQ